MKFKDNVENHLNYNEADEKIKILEKKIIRSIFNNYDNAFVRNTIRLRKIFEGESFYYFHRNKIIGPENPKILVISNNPLWDTYVITNDNKRINLISVKLKDEKQLRQRIARRCKKELIKLGYKPGTEVFNVMLQELEKDYPNIFNELM